MKEDEIPDMIITDEYLGIVSDIEFYTFKFLKPHTYFMKGQIRIISELLIFATGMLMASFVIYIFTPIHISVSNLSQEDQLNNVADLIANSFMKVVKNQNTTIRLKIPTKLSNVGYKIYVSDKVVLKTKNMAITKELFNITESYTINSPPSISSSAETLKIDFDGSIINVRR